MKKIIVYVILIIIGIILPDIVKFFRQSDSLDFPDIYQERDQVRIMFIESPSRNNIEKIWDALFYQGCNNKDKYDLFPYEWYMAFNDNDYIAINTIHRMLLDTIYNENHYIPNTTMKEFADRIESIKKQLEKKCGAE